MRYGELLACIINPITANLAPCHPFFSMSIDALLPLLKVLLAFCAMLVGIRLRLGLFLSLLAGSLLLALLFGMGPLSWLAAAFEGVAQSQALFLCAIVAVILVLSDLLDHCGQAGRLLDALGGRIKSPRLSLAFFPALIGLLPMPGGAVFSAPMVKTMAERMPRNNDTAEQMTVPPTDQALINYWYRHVWELAWPLYPGVILAASLSGIPLVQLALLLSPAPVAGIVAGWFFILRPSTKNVPRSSATLPPMATDTDTSLHTILREGAPLLVAIAGAVLLEVAIATLAPAVPFEWGVIVALLLSMSVAALQNRVPPGRVLRMFAKKHLLNMLSVVLVIFVFKEVLQQSGAIQRIADTAGGDAALFAAAVFLPFFVGMISGLNIAFVGASFPLILGLLQQTGQQELLYAYVAVGMFAGYAGVMASPLHLCFILTCQYFQVGLHKAWRRIMPPCLCIAGTGVAYFFVLQWWQ